MRLRKRTQRRIDYPAARCRSRLQKERGKHENAGNEKEPVRQHIHEPGGHVPRADLQRNQKVAEGTAQSCR